MKQALIVAIALVALVALPASIWAQAKPDFSGSWTFDEAKSDPAPAGRGGGGGGGRGGGRGGGAPATAMTIKQDAAQLTMNRTMAQGAQTLAYKLDGSESTNTIGPGEAKSKATWEGSKLVVTTSQTMQGRGGEPMTVEAKEVYSLDGGVLTIDMTRTTPFGTQNRKLIYMKGM